MTMATTTPMMTAVSTEVGGTVGRVGERNTLINGTRLLYTCTVFSKLECDRELVICQPGMVTC